MDRETNVHDEITSSILNKYVNKKCIIRPIWLETILKSKTNSNSDMDITY